MQVPTLYVEKNRTRQLVYKAIETIETIGRRNETRPLVDRKAGGEWSMECGEVYHYFDWWVRCCHLIRLALVPAHRLE